MKKSFDNLKILSKQQIIDYLKQECFFRQPGEKEIKLFLWQIKSKENSIKMDKHLADKSRRIAAKKADELGAKFNQETDTTKKLSILKEREKHMKILIRHQDEYKKLDKEYNQIQKLIE